MILANPRHEAFARAVAGGTNATRAYVQAGYAEGGATQSAARLMRDGRIQDRIGEIRAEINAHTVAVQIRDQNSRLEAANARWQLMQALALKQLNIEMMVDIGLLRETRAIEEHVAKEMAQWTDHHEHSGPGGAPIAVTDARLARLTAEELAQLEAMARKLDSAEEEG